MPRLSPTKRRASLHEVNDGDKQAEPVGQWTAVGIPLLGRYRCEVTLHLQLFFDLALVKPVQQ